MATIIAGRFAQQTQIQEAIDALLRAGFSQNEISSFYVNPAGQHDYYPLGGDHDKSPGAEESETGSLSGLAAGGAVGAAFYAYNTLLGNQRSFVMKDVFLGPEYSDALIRQ